MTLRKASTLESVNFFSEQVQQLENTLREREETRQRDETINRLGAIISEKAGIPSDKGELLSRSISRMGAPATQVQGGFVDNSWTTRTDENGVPLHKYDPVTKRWVSNT